MTTGERVRDKAREWIGTPFQFQQACKGAGCDCKGLISGVAAELGLSEAQSSFARMADYRRVDTRLLRLGLEVTLDEVPAGAHLLPGDVLLMKLAGKVQHLGIYCGGGRMIHTMPAGPSQVRETPMGKRWWAAVDSAWRWR